jgi:hypothetical protein
VDQTNEAAPDDPPIHHMRWKEAKSHGNGNGNGNGNGEATQAVATVVVIVAAVTTVTKARPVAEVATKEAWLIIVVAANKQGPRQMILAH